MPPRRRGEGVAAAEHSVLHLGDEKVDSKLEDEVLELLHSSGNCSSRQLLSSGSSRRLLSSGSRRLSGNSNSSGSRRLTSSSRG